MFNRGGFAGQRPMGHAAMTQPGMNHPGMNMSPMNMSGLNMSAMNMSGMTMSAMNQPNMNQPNMNLAGMNHPAMTHQHMGPPVMTHQNMGLSGMNQPNMNMNLNRMTLPTMNQGGGMGFNQEMNTQAFGMRSMDNTGSFVGVNADPMGMKAVPIRPPMHTPTDRLMGSQVLTQQFSSPNVAMHQGQPRMPSQAQEIPSIVNRVVTHSSDRMMAKPNTPLQEPAQRMKQKRWDNVNYGNAGQEMGMQSIQGGPSLNQVPSPQNRYTNESASSILESFGLSNEDLEELSRYPDDQLTPSNMPAILRDIRLRKMNRTTSVPDQAAGRRPGNDAVTSKVIDYGHSSKYKFNEPDAPVRPYEPPRTEQKPPPVPKQPVVSSNTKPKQSPQKKMDNKIPTISGSRKPVWSASKLDRSNNKTLVGEDPTEPVDGAVTVPKVDSPVITIQAEATVIPEVAAPVQTELKPTIPVVTGVSQVACQKPAEQPAAAKGNWKPVVSQEETQKMKKVPTPSMMNDYYAASPRIFPHICSLCSIECRHLKDWIKHQNNASHIESCRNLRQQYPDWNPQVLSSARNEGKKDETKSQTSKSKSISPRRSKRSGSRQRTRKSHSRSPRSSGKKSRSRSRSPRRSRYSPRRRSRSPRRHRRSSHSKSPDKRAVDAAVQSFLAATARLKNEKGKFAKQTGSGKKAPPKASNGNKNKKPGNNAPGLKKAGSVANSGGLSKKPMAPTKKPEYKKPVVSTGAKKTTANTTSGKKPQATQLANKNDAGKVIRVTNLPDSGYTNQDILKIVQPFGKVCDILVNHSKNEAFMKTNFKEAAAAAVEFSTSNPIMINNQRVTLSLADQMEAPVKSPDRSEKIKEPAQAPAQTDESKAPLTTSKDTPEKEDPDKKPQEQLQQEMELPEGFVKRYKLVDPPHKDSDKCVIVISNLPEGQYTVDEISNLTKPFGGVNDILIVANHRKAYLELTSKNSLDSLMKFYNVFATYLSGNLLSISAAPRFKDLKDEDIIFADLIEQASYQITPTIYEKFIYLTNLPEKVEDEFEILRVGLRFGRVEHHVFFSNKKKAIFLMHSSSAAKTMHSFLSQYPCSIGDNVIQCSVPSKTKLAEDEYMTYLELERHSVDKDIEKPAPDVSESKEPDEKPEETSVKKPEETALKKTEEKGVKKPDEKGVKKPDEKGVKKPDEKGVKKPDEKAVKKPDEKGVKKPDEKGVKKPDEKAVKKPGEKAVKKPEEKAVKKTEEKAVKKTEEKTIKKSEEKAVKKHEEKAAKKPEEKGTKKRDEKPVKKLDEKPVKKLDEKPVKKLDEKPVKKLDEKPVKKTVDKVVKKTDDKVVKTDETSVKHEEKVERTDEKAVKKPDEKTEAQCEEKTDLTEENPSMAKDLEPKVEATTSPPVTTCETADIADGAGEATPPPSPKDHLVWDVDMAEDSSKQTSLEAIPCDILAMATEDDDDDDDYGGGGGGDNGNGGVDEDDDEEEAAEAPDAPDTLPVYVQSEPVVQFHESHPVSHPLVSEDLEVLVSVESDEEESEDKDSSQPLPVPAADGTSDKEDTKGSQDAMSKPGQSLKAEDVGNKAESSEDAAAEPSSSAGRSERFSTRTEESKLRSRRSRDRRSRSSERSSRDKAGYSEGRTPTLRTTKYNAQKGEISVTVTVDSQKSSSRFGDSRKKTSRERGSSSYESSTHRSSNNRSSPGDSASSHTKSGSSYSQKKNTGKYSSSQSERESRDTPRTRERERERDARSNRKDDATRGSSSSRYTRSSKSNNRSPRSKEEDKTFPFNLDEFVTVDEIVEEHVDSSKQPEEKSDTSRRGKRKESDPASSDAKKSRVIDTGSQEQSFVTLDEVCDEEEGASAQEKPADKADEPLVTLDEVHTEDGRTASTKEEPVLMTLDEVSDDDADDDGDAQDSAAEQPSSTAPEILAKDQLLTLDEVNEEDEELTTPAGPSSVVETKILEDAQDTKEKDGAKEAEPEAQEQPPTSPAEGSQADHTEQSLLTLDEVKAEDEEMTFTDIEHQFLTVDEIGEEEEESEAKTKDKSSKGNVESNKSEDKEPTRRGRPRKRPLQSAEGNKDSPQQATPDTSKGVASKTTPAKAKAAPYNQKPDNIAATPDKSQKAEGKPAAETPAKKTKLETPPAERKKLAPYNSGTPVGLEFLIPKTGYFCELCSLFYMDDSSKLKHCKSLRHYQAVEKHLAKSESSCEGKPSGS
ncbi:zinc finger protein 638 [Dendropsophus ebraccatus]|uniref:zinc finger protein 638 n=1 Tax=Dendropsophus ebraccatus TaxID=150705 RepID=UPI0038320C34